MAEETRQAKIGNLSFKYAWIAVSILTGTALAYSLLLVIQAPKELLGWINELLSTLLSVTAAFLIGVKLYSLQTKSTDDKKREDLRSLVQSELAETITSFGRSMTIVEEDEPEKPGQSKEVSLMYVQPLILEEAAKSGLFVRDVTFNMLRVAKVMRTYNLQVDQANAYLSLRDGTMYAIHLNKIKQAENSVVMGCRKMLRLIE